MQQLCVTVHVKYVNIIWSNWLYTMAFASTLSQGIRGTVSRSRAFRCTCRLSFDGTWVGEMLSITLGRVQLCDDNVCNICDYYALSVPLKIDLLLLYYALSSYSQLQHPE